jgi:hypothetical protein
MADLVLSGLVIAGVGEFYLQNLLNGVQSDVPPVAPDLVGIDLCASTRGLHRVFQTSGSVYCQTAGPGASDWGTPVLIASTAATDAIPTIACSPGQDELLLVAWHAADDGTEIYRSPDYGATWEPHAEFGGKFPRIACGFGKIALVNWYSTELRVWVTSNMLTSIGDPVLAFTADEQLGALFYKWDGLLAILYEEAGDILRRVAVDGNLEWGAPEAAFLLSVRPTATNLFPVPVGTRWVGLPGSETSETVAASGATIPLQYLGIAGRREDAFAVARDEDGVLHTFWSAGVRADWEEVA